MTDKTVKRFKVNRMKKEGKTLENYTAHFNKTETRLKSKVFNLERLFTLTLVPSPLRIGLSPKFVVLGGEVWTNWVLDLWL